MASVKVVLYTSKTLKNGEHPVMVRIIKDRKPVYITLNASSSKENWDSKNNVPKKKHPLFKELTILIDRKKSDVNKIILGYDSVNKDYGAADLKIIIKRPTYVRKTVFTFFDEIIKRLENANRIGYAKVFKATKNSLKTFTKGRDTEFSDITGSFIRKYEECFLSREVALNSVFVFMRTLKTLINYAKAENIVNKDFDPFSDYSFKKFRRIQTKKRFLTREQIKLIEDLEIHYPVSLLDAKNVFLFSFYCRGINFIDLAHLTWGNLSNRRLEYTRKKTNEFFSIALLDPAQKILEYYKSRSTGKYIFPFLSETHKTAKSKSNRLVKCLKMVNGNLKTIATMSNIKTDLTTYVARHSYAMALRSEGVNISYISQSMGHDSESTTKIYLNQFGDDTLDEVNKILAS